MTNNKFLVYGKCCQACVSLKAQFAKQIDDGQIYLICAEDNMPLCKALGIKNLPTVIEVGSGFEAAKEILER